MISSGNKNNMNKNITFILSISVFILVFIFWLMSPYIVDNIVIPFAPNNNDLVGVYTVVATLFSGLAFSALLITIVIQSKQLLHQKNELLKFEKSNNVNAKLAAYTALLSYYNSKPNSYDPDVLNLTPMDIVKRIDAIIKTLD